MRHRNLSAIDEVEQLRRGDDVIVFCQMFQKITIAFDASIVLVGTVTVLVPVHQRPGVQQKDHERCPMADAARQERGPPRTVAEEFGLRVLQPGPPVFLQAGQDIFFRHGDLHHAVFPAEGRIGGQTVQTLLVVDRAHGVVEGKGDVVLCQRAEGPCIPAKGAGAECPQRPAEDAGKHAAEIVYDKVILVIRILVHEARPVLEMELRPEVCRQVLGMCVHFHILTITIEPAYYFFHFISPYVCTTHVHKKDMLDAELVAYGAHLAHAGRTVGMFPPDKTTDVIRFCPVGQGLCIDCNENVFVRHS